MSLTYGFYNSKNHDRKYDAEQISRIFDGVITDGVYHSIGTAFSVTAGTGLSVNVGSGRAWFNHTWTFNDAVLVLTIPAAHAVYTRIDAVIIQVNRQTRTNSIVVKAGTPSGTPKPPTMSSENQITEYPLAYVTVPNGVTSIKSSNIRTMVGSSLCPFVAGVQNGVNIDNLLQTWIDEFGDLINASQTEFDILFTELRDQISQATSGTLIDGSVTFKKLSPDAVRRRFSNTRVNTTTFVADTTYQSQGYGYKANIPLVGVDNTMQPEVIFAVKDVGDIGPAPIAVSYGTAGSGDGGVTIYVSNKPTAAITIPTITCWR